MKIRTSFVTNSSSSSFIVCHNKTFNKNQKNLLEEFVKENLSDESSYETKNLKKQAIDVVYHELQNGDCIKSEKELRNLFEQEYQLSECEAVVNKYNSYLKSLQSGKSITEVYIDRNYDLVSIELFRDLCNILKSDDDFDFIEEGEDL